MIEPGMNNGSESEQDCYVDCKEICPMSKLWPNGCGALDSAYMLFITTGSGGDAKNGAADEIINHAKKELEKLMKDLSDVKVGDYVWTIQGGCYSKVTKTGGENSYSLNVSVSEDRECNYTLDGKYYDTDQYPSVFLVNPFDENDLPPCKFKKGEVVAVGHKRCLRVFSKMEEGKFLCFQDGTRSGTTICWSTARKLTDKERGLCD